MFSLRRILLTAFLIASVPHQSLAAQGFNEWLQGVRTEAASKGISQNTIRSALSNVTHIDRVIELDRKQPESRLTFPEYKNKVISSARINEGRELLRQHRTLLQSASASTCGIDPAVIVALWGMETSYGKNTGNFSVINALATLAYDGRRSSFFRGELIKALKIIDEGHISVSEMEGSWAGAMGQNQFMPSSFHAYAIDGNGDGKRDIWNSLPDVFASTANYLCKSGWRADERWGRAVRTSQPIPSSLMGLDTRRSLREWSAMGVTLPNGQPLPSDSDMEASLVLPEGSSTPYLAYNNYRTIMKWNRSVYFATSVGILSDAIASAP
jgi:membrane-bound lytic murein transglycosylase B